NDGAQARASCLPAVGGAALQLTKRPGRKPSGAASGGFCKSLVYYLPGTSGWSSSFGGRPALLWNPAPAADAAFGFLDGLFGFTLTGTALIPVRVQATTNLRSAVWSSVTNTAIGAAGTVDVRDPESTAHAARFYRFVWP
ncbi:MAG: hypothetical protein RBU24_02590, partial [Kiritimatiellia bacterium]|nr:hypothetical protein [Kiritimatiellia bacterium]